MHLTASEIREVYDGHAHHYDLALKLYALVGLRANAYRLRAIELMHLHPGDCVVDLGCGTGLSFAPIIERIGSEGRLIGVDLAPGMLSIARERVRRSGWRNVELVEADISAYEFPEDVNGVLAVGSFGYIADYASVIKKVALALAPGGHLVILDGKQPENWPDWLFRRFVWLFKPFRLNLDYFAGHPWEAVNNAFQESAFEELYGGLMYISSGAVPKPVNH
jgi:demethylmenaquinone methyltransferase/2-methoxy-6-polyprenyl-1,4-benzoquinol methylase